ncbi:MAG: His/Gly/Thr/Pro-type tRNA ligase C-terminal domain-containing protein [bacterium]
MALFDVRIPPLDFSKSEHRDPALRLLGETNSQSLDCLIDDRELRPGVKFAEAGFLGIPLRLAIGDKSLRSGSIEAQHRDGRVSETFGIEAATSNIRDLTRDSNQSRK